MDDERGPWELPSEAGGRRFRRVLAGGLALSALAHVGLMLLPAEGLVPRPAPAEPGPALAHDGSQGLRAVQLPAGGAPDAVPPPPRPVPSVEATPPVEIRAPSQHLAVAFSAVPAPGPGALGGSASAEGGGGGEGEPRQVAPVPRSLVPQWDPPSAVKGLRVTVLVHVDARGRPTGEVRLEPPTPDRSFNRKLVEKVRAMSYHPARRDGRPVPGWARITFVF